MRDGLLATIDGLDRPASHWREHAASLYDVPMPTEPIRDPLSPALELAGATAEDGQQRALDVRVGSLEALHDVRMRVRGELAETPAGDRGRHVLPWVWRWESGGQPLTEAGNATGYELRFSRYEKPRS